VSLVHAIIVYIWNLLLIDFDHPKTLFKAHDHFLNGNMGPFLAFVMTVLFGVFGPMLYKRATTDEPVFGGKDDQQGS
jgi:hypothetical protein